MKTIHNSLDRFTIFASTRVIDFPIRKLMILLLQESIERRFDQVGDGGQEITHEMTLLHL